VRIRSPNLATCSCTVSSVSTLKRFHFGSSNVKNLKLWNYWGFFFGLCPSSGMLETRKQNVSEIGSVSVFE
jgi:hypothetical protein